MKNRSWPVLLLGFGTLIALIAFSGLAAVQSARDTYRQISALNDRHRQIDRLLGELGSEIHVIGLLTRDYLLDPSNVSAAEYRARLVEVHSSMEGQLRDLAGVILQDDVKKVLRLRQEVDGYWNAIDPLFTWTPQEKQALSWTFLRRQVLPRREAALSIAKEIRDLTQVNLDRQRQEIDRKEAEMPLYIGRMLIMTVLVGIVIAGATLYRMTKLEQRSVSDRQRTEAAEEELRRLSRQLVQTQEQERKSISRELHDEIGQMLTALRMELRNLQEVRSAPEGQFNEKLNDAKRLAEQSLRAVRDMAAGLRPAVLDDLGLGAAIQWQAREFARHAGVPVNVQLDGALTDLPDQYRTCIYRVVQEALTNCARHAHASTIQVSIDRRDDQILVTVQDDGIGFNASAIRARGLGLIGIQERIKELGGEFKLSSWPAKGTALAASIPISRDASQS